MRSEVNGVSSQSRFFDLLPILLINILVQGKGSDMTNKFFAAKYLTIAT